MFLILIRELLLLINVINLYVTFGIKPCPYYVGNGFMLENSIFGAVKLPKNVDTDEHSYSGYGVLFDINGTFPLRYGGLGAFGMNIIIIGAHMSASVHVGNKKRYFNSR